MARRSRFVRPAPRTKMWIGAGVGPATIVGSTVRTVSGLTAGALLLRPFTVLRTRLIVHIESDQAIAAEANDGAFGYIVVTDTASSLGITAIPTPLLNPEADWFVFQPLSFNFLHLSSVGFEGNSGVQYIVDSKAMRKVGPDDDIAGIVQMRGADGSVITTTGRRLIQLH